MSVPAACRPIAALLALLTLALLGGPGPAEAEPAWPQTLKVAQYNVQFVTPWRFGRVSRKHWPNTAARARAIGTELACFDIVALNETINAVRRAEIFAAMEQAAAACGRPSRLAGGRWFAVLAGPAPAAPSLAGIAAWLTGDAALAWLGDEVALASRLPVVASAQIAYSTARGSDALAAKGVLHARLRRGDAPGGEALDLFVTHLQANHADIRARQLAELAAFIRARSDPALPAILLGDLNIDGSAAARADPGAEYHGMLRTLATLGFRDPGQALAGTDSWQRRRIDYLLLRSARLSVADLRTEQFDDLLARALSDHAALTAELRWRSAASLAAGRNNPGYLE
jgi:endonuclease/exonuclease/phosphatase family metal-dependent hydrolase